MQNYDSDSFIESEDDRQMRYDYEMRMSEAERLLDLKKELELLEQMEQSQKQIEKINILKKDSYGYKI